MTTTPEPKDKLDTMSEMAFAAAMAALGVNGPEDDTFDWSAINWWATEENVRRLRQRIFTGLLEPDAWKRARPVLRGGRAAMRPAYPAESGHTQRPITARRVKARNCR
jgi:hypothetical protein